MKVYKGTGYRTVFEDFEILANNRQEAEKILNDPNFGVGYFRDPPNSLFDDRWKIKSEKEATVKDIKRLSE
jgi:hypothetical protein